MRKLFLILAMILLLVVNVSAITSLTVTDLMVSAAKDSLIINDTIVVSIQLPRTFAGKMSLYATDLSDSLVAQLYMSPVEDSCLYVFVAADSLHSRTKAYVYDTLFTNNMAVKYAVWRIYNPKAAHVFKGELYLIWK